jgi:hypothetical protein
VAVVLEIHPDDCGTGTTEAAVATTRAGGEQGQGGAVAEQFFLRLLLVHDEARQLFENGLNRILDQFNLPLVA